MKKIFVLMIIFVTNSHINAQRHFVFPFQNPELSVEKRADDIISRLTLEEKISQMVYNAAAIDRLGIPAYNWWNECLHGVARNGLATVFPQAIGLAAMWDKTLMLEVGKVISDEARAKYNSAVEEGERGIYQGLTFWSPNINIFRDPRWGRGMETYGEDPYLTGQTAVQFIKGLQGDNPKYFKTIATSKHYAVHSGPEPDRHSFDAEVSEYDLRETYLPAFKASVTEANVQSIMCAYNSFRGLACCGNDPLLNGILRNEWGFGGYVVSDCWAIQDIWEYHKQAADASEAAAVAVKSGTDLNCGVSFSKLFEAVNKKLVTEEDIDKSLKRLFDARIRLGMFDPPEMVPFNKIKMDAVDSQANRRIALQAARESIVLLKNDGNILPLKKNLKTIAVIGPNADDVEVLYGNYNGFARNPVTPLNGIKNKVGKQTKILFEDGCDLAQNMPLSKIISPEYFFMSSDKKQKGLKGEYFDNPEFAGKPKHVRTDKNVNFEWWTDVPFKDFKPHNFSVRWTGYLAAPSSGEYRIGGWAFNGMKIYLEDSLLVDFHHDHHPNKKFAALNLEAGKLYRIKVEYYSNLRYSVAQLFWTVPDSGKETRALAAAKKSDAVIMFMGISPRLEGEEMKVPVPGFSGGDRLSLDLPDVQQNLIKKIAAVGKPVVLVLLNGSALGVNWENENIASIIESWYGGQSAGTAIADVIFGDYNPGGRLPVTFYKSVDQLPEFGNYDMKGRTYRYFEGDVLYPFGYGLSYSKFEYSNLKIDKNEISAVGSAVLTVDVKNTGRYSGDEIVQLYVKGKGLNAGDAIKTLKGFERINLKPGEKKTVSFNIDSETLQVFREGKGFTVEKGEHQLMIGPSSADKDLRSLNITVQ